MAKADSGTSRRERNKTARWVVTIFITTIFVSGAISLLSDAVMENSSIAVAFLILLAIVLFLPNGLADLFTRLGRRQPRRESAPEFQREPEGGQ